MTPSRVVNIGAVLPGTDDVSLRCSQCKVVVNEMLAFISNKVDTLPETGIVQICLSAYSSEEIETARSIAYKLMAPSKSYRRKKEGSEQKNIQEIVKLIKEFEPDCLPNFVAKNLNKLPAVSFDYIDVTSFLKELTLLKNDVASMKTKSYMDNDNTTSITDIELLKKDIDDIKTMIKELREVQDTSNRPTEEMFTAITCPTENNAGRTELQNERPVGTDLNRRGRRSVRSEESLHTHTLTAASRTTPAHAHGRQAAPATTSQPSRVSADTTLSTHQLDECSDCTNNMPTYRDVANTNRDNLCKTNNDEGFTVITRKKLATYRHKNTRGTMQNNASKLQAADLYSYVYVSRTQKNISEDDIKEHIKEMKESCIDVQKLNQYRETNFNSFKITILNSKLSTFLQNDFWPEGLVFRKYRQQRIIRNVTAAPNK